MVFRATYRRAALVGVALLGAACQGPAPPPHGAPVLTHIYWITADQTVLVWRPEGLNSEQIASAAPPYVKEIDFVFDRRLDGARIEDTFTENGVLMTKPKDAPPLTVSWPGMEAATTKEPFRLVVEYNSVPRYGGESSYVFARPARPGLPAGQTVAFQLALDQLTSAYGDPADAPAKIPVKTAPFGVSVSAPTAAVSGTYQVPLVFNNRLPVAPATSPLIHVRAAGADVPYKLLSDATLDARWYVAPADCLGTWPASTTFELTIDAGFTDVFGGKLSEAATATFKTGAASSGAADCGGAGVVDAGADAPVEAAPDAGAAPDASPEASSDASLDASLEASPDAGAPDAADAVPDGGVDAAEAA